MQENYHKRPNPKRKGFCLTENTFACTICGSFDTVKKGKRFSVLRGFWSQRFLCRTCGKKFTKVEKRVVELPAFAYQDQPIPETDWVALTKAQNDEKRLLIDILLELLEKVEVIDDPEKKGRKFSDIRDIVFCLALKTYTGLSSRRLDSDLQQALQREFIQKVPHFTTLMNYLEKPELTRLLQELVRLSALPIKEVDTQFSIDSSGFSSSQFGRWFDFKYGEEKVMRDWVKAHIMCSNATHLVTAVEFTKAYGADSPQLQPLIEKTCFDFNVKEVSGDKAYCSRRNFQIISSWGATPYLLFKKNDTPNSKGCQIWSKCFRYFKNNPQAFMEKYHRRSNVETCFAMIKQKFGKDLMTKKYSSQCNEILLKILLHNCTCLIKEFYENKIENYYSTQTQKIQIKPF